MPMPINVPANLKPQDFQGLFAGEHGEWHSDDEESFSTEEVNVLFEKGGMKYSRWQELLKQSWKQRSLRPVGFSEKGIFYVNVVLEIK